MASAELTDPGSARVRRLQRLARRRFRTEDRRFLAEGTQVVREALQAAREGSAVVTELFVTPEAASRHRDLIVAADAAQVPVTVATSAVLAALSETVTPQGVIAVVAFVDVSLDQLVERRPRLVAVLADVRDPGNAGSVIRAADAAGADGVVFAGDSVDPYNGKAVRASVGGLFHLPIVLETAVDSAVAALRGAGLAVLVADGSGSLDLDTSDDLEQPTAWVFGNEAWGVPDDLVDAADAAIRIPIYGRAESLNLATAATLCLYASARAQRKGTGGDSH